MQRHADSTTFLARGAGLLPLLWSIVLVYAIFTLWFGRFQTTDEVAFKAAGREWALSGRFAAPEMQGFHNFDPPAEVAWFGQLPVYTFLFGVFVKVFGFHPLQNIAFDLLIHLAVVFLTYAIAKVLAGSGTLSVALAAAAIVPISIIGRADELAMLFGMAAMLLLLTQTSRLVSVPAGLLLGLAVATAALAGGAFALAAVLILVTDPNDVRERFHRTAMCAFAAVVTCTGALAPFLTAYPGVYRQFTSHAAAQLRGQWWPLFENTLHYGWHLAAAGAFIVVTSILLFFIERRIWMRFMLVPTAFVAVLICFFPSKSTYFWYFAPWTAAVFAGFWWKLRERRSKVVAACAAAVCWLVAIIPATKDAIVIATLPEDQRLVPNVAMIRRLVPRASVVLASEYWSSIGNEYRVRYRYANPGNPAIPDVDYVLVTANGSGRPGQPQDLGSTELADVSRNFETIYDNLNRRPTTLFGHRVTNSAWGFGVRILRRTH
jgi:4-amino-4-deoxy-L-arabinose transferase-like glycosyltransferase